MKIEGKNQPKTLDIFKGLLPSLNVIALLCLTKHNHFTKIEGKHQPKPYYQA